MELVEESREKIVEDESVLERSEEKRRLEPHVSIKSINVG